MAKRSWSQAHLEQDSSASSAAIMAATSTINFGDGEPSFQNGTRKPSISSSIPSISRKVKACSACRKMKIKCLMEERGPPCRRCEERNLSCVLNKSLQTLISEKSQWQEDVVHDLETLHASLQEITKRMSLPQLPRLRSDSQSAGIEPETQDWMPEEQADGDTNEAHRNGYRHDEIGPSRDNSPRLAPRDDGLPHIPIESVYHLTKLRALRAPDESDIADSPHRSQGPNVIRDFISRGDIKMEDATRLYEFYVNCLDHYMYGIGIPRPTDLTTLRRKSPILTAAILTVAALHDASSNGIYPACNREFRRLMAASMFDRRIDRDHLRAMVVASYWLSDVSWMISGYAIRRAVEVNLKSSFERAVTEQDDDAADCMRIWYILYICDQHMSTLYNREPILRDDSTIQRWEEFLASPNANRQDKRIISQVALLVITHNARELLQSDNGKSTHRVHYSQLDVFGRQLDQWCAHWSNILQTHDQIGSFPSKGVLIHFHFAKLHLYSHVFRGLDATAVPPHLLGSAAAAVAAAIAVVNLLLTDQDLKEGLAGMPSYMHSMTAFACVFLLKASKKYGDTLVDPKMVFDITNQLVQLFRAVPVGRWHLIHLMAEGLEKTARKLQELDLSPPKNGFTPNGTAVADNVHSNANGHDPSQLLNGGETFWGTFDTTFGLDYNISLTTPPDFFQLDQGGTNTHFTDSSFL